MGTSKLYLAVGFIVLMAEAVDTNGTMYHSTYTSKSEDQEKSTETEHKSSHISQSSTAAPSSTPTTQQASNWRETTTKAVDTWYDIFNSKNVVLMVGAIIIISLLVTNVVLAGSICSLKRSISYWAISRTANPTNKTEEASGAAGGAEGAVEMSAIYTMSGEISQGGKSEEAGNVGGATAKEAEPANGDAQGPEQDEALPAEPPDDVVEVLLVV